MPFYQYLCEDNQLTVEVHHSMSMRLKNWGEVCELAGIDPGNTAVEAAVIRLITSPMPVVWRLKGLDKDAPSRKLEM